jgi:serine protease Do
MAAAPAGDVTSLKKAGSGFAEVAKKAIPAVVFVKVEKSVKMGAGGYYFNNPYEFFGDDFLERFFGGGQRRYMRPEPREFKQKGQGSGFLISKDGFILTNNHVVGEADKITVRLHDGREFTAKRIGSDPKSEVAVIKIEGENLPFLKLGSSSALEIGEWVIAIGNPFGLSETLTVGVVSAKGRSGMGITEYEDFIQTDAAINPGNSGGPLLNIDGEVIGINTAIFSQTGGSLGIGFAVPIDMAKMIKEQLVKTGKVTRGYLGVFLQEITAELAESMGIKEHEGILVGDVMKDSPADKAGLKHGDIILKLNGHEVKNVTLFRNEVSSASPGSKLGLLIVRDGKEKEVSATTDVMPDESTGQGPVLSQSGPGKLGLTLKNITKEIAQEYNLSVDKGALVTEVEPDSVAEHAGIEPGHVILGVNRKSVSNIVEFNKAIAEAKDKVFLRVTDGRFTRYIPLKMK